MKNIFAYLTLIFGVFAVSTSAIFVRLADAPSAITAFYRLFLTTLMLLPVVLLGKQQRQELKQLSAKKLGLCAAAGILLGIHYILWFESLSYTSVASSTVLVTLQPLFSITFGFLFLKEHQHRLGLIGCAIALTGSFIIGYGDFQLNPSAFIGDVMAVLAAAVVSMYLFIGQIVRKDTSATVYSVLAFGSSSLFLAIYALIMHQPFTGYSSKTWASFIGIAIIAPLWGNSSSICSSNGYPLPPSPWGSSENQLALVYLHGSSSTKQLPCVKALACASSSVASPFTSWPHQ